MTPLEKIKKEFDKMTNRGWFAFPEETWSFFEQALKGVRKETLDLIADNQGWEETRDLYAKKLGIPEIYKGILK